MAQAQGIREVGYFDCPGGGQVVVDRNIAYIGHTKSPHGTSTMDVSDPARPRLLETLEIEKGTHSHKVRVENNLMLINREVMPFPGGVSPDAAARLSAASAFLGLPAMGSRARAGET